MDAKLVVVGGDTEATEVKLRLPSILGRGREASLTVPHPLISRQHCEIFDKDGFLVVRDLGSLNGTFIDDERISEAVLHDGALLTIGTVTFRAVYTDDPNLSAPPREDAPAIESPAVADDVPLPEDQEATEKQPEPQAIPASAEAEPAGDDDGFAAFLKSVDVEDGPGEEAAQVNGDVTIDSSPPEIAEGVEEVEVVDVPAIDEPLPIEEVPLADADVPAAEQDAVASVDAAEPSPASEDAGKMDADQNLPQDDEDELQSFLKELDI